MGLVYLENNSLPGAFYEDRLPFVDMIASQVAVSVENALLYEDMEGKIGERTRELRHALEEIHELKDRQDGDYFLTSLLLKPFVVRGMRAGPVRVESFVKQKKEFVFRKQRHEIGGDVNIARSIFLHNSPHTVFLNGDAMGKSLQGAGGVLVLGSIFESILEQTRRSEHIQRESPTQWLRQSFVGLRRAFESFDGSMMMSVVLGVVDDESGMMWFLNAEHPFVVLYRKKRAVFLEKEMSYRKLGVATEDEIRVKRFRLRKGDVVIVGSDGRDDIFLGTKDGARVINEDESLFLKHVEAGGGELGGIVESIRAGGELTDDLSLLRVEYAGGDSPPDPDRTINPPPPAAASGALDRGTGSCSWAGPGA